MPYRAGMSACSRNIFLLATSRMSSGFAPSIISGILVGISPKLDRTMFSSWTCVHLTAVHSGIFSLSSGRLILRQIPGKGAILPQLFNLRSRLAVSSSRTITKSKTSFAFTIGYRLFINLISSSPTSLKSSNTIIGFFRRKDRSIPGIVGITSEASSSPPPPQPQIEREICIKRSIHESISEAFAGEIAAATAATKSVSQSELFS
mmetsp:Transcript_31350/g.31841  ORF Transcript_31350/g.31841 Transcript_31350/m.31841 type:complete len:205 (-) Transcript_31350:72-686(-)